MSGVAKLIERQAAVWGVKDRLETLAAPPFIHIEGDVRYGPCLLVSRECASGGALVARQAGERLGWQVFDGEMVDEITRVTHERKHLMENVDEHVRSAWEATWREILLASDSADVKYLHALRQVVMTLGHRGSVVIVGRGAQYLLPVACALRVRVVAPLEQRVNRLAERERCTKHAARSRVREIDYARETFIWKTFKKRSDSPLNYDLLLNTGEVGIEGATNIVLGAVAEKLRALPVNPGQKPISARPRATP